MSFTKCQSTCAHFKGNMFARKSMRMKHSIRFAVIYPRGHVCMQSHTLRTENSIRFAYIAVRADGK